MEIEMEMEMEKNTREEGKITRSKTKIECLNALYVLYMKVVSTKTLLSRRESLKHLML